MSTRAPTHTSFLRLLDRENWQALLDMQREMNDLATSAADRHAASVLAAIRAAAPAPRIREQYRPRAWADGDFL